MNSFHYNKDIIICLSLEEENKFIYIYFCLDQFKNYAKMVGEGKIKDFEIDWIIIHHELRFHSEKDKIFKFAEKIINLIGLI